MLGSLGGIIAGRAFVVIQALDKTGPTLRVLAANLTSFGHAIAGIGAGLVGVSAALLAPLIEGAKRFMAFDDIMRNLRVKSEGTEREFRALRAQALHLGETTAFTANQVGELQFELGKLGFNRNAIGNMTEAIVHFARATDNDLLPAWEMVGEVMNIFKMDAADTTKVVDMLTVAANESAADIDDLMEAMKYAGPAARDMNIPLSETLAILGFLANVGVKGTMAGTAFRRIVPLIAQNEAQLRSLGAEIRRTDRNARPLVDILADLEKSLGGFDNIERAKIFHELFMIRGSTTAQALGKAGLAYDVLQHKIENADGRAKESAELMDSGLGGAWRKVLGALNNLGIAIGESISKPLTEVINNFRLAIKMTTEFVKANPLLVWSIATIAVVLGLIGAFILGIAALVLTLGGLIGSITAIVSSVAVIGGILAMLMFILAAVGLVVLGLGLVGMFLGALTRLILDATGMADNFARAWVNVYDTFMKAYNGISNALTSGRMNAALHILVTALKSAFFEAIDEIMDGFSDLGTGVLTDLRKDIKTTRAEVDAELKFLLEGAKKSRSDLLGGGKDPSPFPPGTRQSVPGIDSSLLQGQGVRAYKLIEGLELGTLEARRVGLENKNSSLLAKIASTGENTVTELRAIRRNTDKMAEEEGL